MKPKPAVSIAVTTHARERARARFPGFKAARIIDEVREAIVAGRFSPRKPASLEAGSGEHALYAWTADELRVYVLRAHADTFSVVTTLGGEEPAGGSSPA